jgi:ferredoxin-type protein NapF
MKAFHFLKKARVAIATFTLIFATAIFLDIYHLIPVEFVKSALATQLAPSFINLLKAGGIILSGFVIISFISLIVGRVYCSTLCPLGILMDMVIAVRKKFSKKKIRFKHIKILMWLPFSILALTVLLLLMGNIQLISLLDPYSNFGRIFTVLFKPVLIGVNNLVYDGLLTFDNYTLQPIDINYSNIPVFIFVLIFFLTILALSVKKGRFFCTHICPVGSYLGMISKLSVFKVKINSEKCISCGKCEHDCKAGCISAKEKMVDYSKCVMCLNCINTECPVDSITLTNKKFNTTPVKSPKVDKEVDTGSPARRRAIQAMALSPLLLAKNLFAHPDSKSEKKEFKERLVPISPPGSLNHKHFTESCTACYLCVNVCPSNVIKPSLTEYGLQAAMLPHLTNEKGYCNLECTRCTDVCPNGALLPVSIEEKKTLQIGIAHFVREKCVVITDGTDCGACSEHCPTKAVNMELENGLFVPVVDESICIGCGACEYACPVDHPKAIFIEGNPIHQLADKPKVEKLEPVDHEEDFPF